MPDWWRKYHALQLIIPSPNVVRNKLGHKVGHSPTAEQVERYWKNCRPEMKAKWIAKVLELKFEG
jgi:hypothetical protein